MANFNWKNPMDDTLKIFADKYKENLKDVTDIAGLRNRFDEMRNGTYQGVGFQGNDAQNAQDIMQAYIAADNRYKAYQRQANSINTNRNTQLQQNSINRQKSLQNLTRIQQANGTSGLGTSQSALLQAGANFANNRTQINMDSNNLLSKAQDGLFADSEEYKQMLLARLEDERKNYSISNYNRIKDEWEKMIENGLPTNDIGQYSQSVYKKFFDEAEQLYKGGYMTDIDFQNLNSILKGNGNMYTDNEDSITENVNKNSVYTGANGNQSIGYGFTFGDDEYKRGKNFVVNVGGNEYKVEIADGNAVDTSSWLGTASNTISKLASNQVFTYQGKVYLKGKDGNVYAVKRRNASYGDDYNNLYNALFRWDKKQS